LRNMIFSFPKHTMSIRKVLVMTQNNAQRDCNHCQQGGYSAGAQPPQPPVWKILTHSLHVHYLKLKGGNAFYIKNSSASGVFAPWTPTRALPWTHWGL
jgi:hypothetical protein